MDFQVLTKKGNHNDLFLICENTFIVKTTITKIFQLTAYWSNSTNQCKRYIQIDKIEALEKISGKFIYSKTNKLVKDVKSNAITLFIFAISIENDLKIVEMQLLSIRKQAFQKLELTRKQKQSNMV